MAKDIIEIFKQKFQDIESLVNGNGDSSLLDLRRKAFDSFLDDGIPTRKHEEWKYTNISFLNKIDFSVDPIFENQFFPDGFNPENYSIIGIDTYKIVFLNGKIQLDFCDLPASGFSVKEVNLKDSNISSQFNIDGKQGPFQALNTALCESGIEIEVEKNKVIDKPVNLIYIWSSEKPAFFNHALLLNIDENASIDLIENSYQINSSEKIVNKVTVINMSGNSNINYDKLQNSNELFTFDSIEVNQMASSRLKANTVSLRGGFIRNEVKISLSGKGAETEINGFFLTKDNKLVDNHILIEHNEPDCLSRQLFKGVLADKSTGVFRGKVLVNKKAQKTNAYQSNKNILLSNEAQINTKPQLEIYADDVKCSHGATSGYIDKEAMFYLISRGIGEENALKLLLKAFANEVSTKFASEEFSEFVSGAVSDALDFNY